MRDSAEFWLAWRDADRTELEEALADVVGVAAFRNGDAPALAQETVFALFVRGLATLAPETDSLARACGLALTICARI